jgi:hypothetical protein
MAGYAPAKVGAKKIAAAKTQTVDRITFVRLMNRPPSFNSSIL